MPRKRSLEHRSGAAIFEILAAAKSSPNQSPHSPTPKQTLRFAHGAQSQLASPSYTKNPRWKTGLGLGAGSLLFPPMVLIAIPVGFTKHRRHWLTIRSDKDYAVLKVSKSIRKIFIPNFETRLSVKVEAVGENK